MSYKATNSPFRSSDFLKGYERMNEINSLAIVAESSDAVEFRMIVLSKD